MVRRVVNYMLLCGLGVAVISCINTPEFSVEPSISFNSIVFKKGLTEFDADTLRVTMDFTDGDGDLGLNKDYDVGPPYNELFGFYKADSTYVTYADRFNPKYDTLPPYEFPYYCTNYFIQDNDTIFVVKNKFHFNIFVKYFVKKNGVYSEFDWVTAFDPICGETFNGRFPILENLNRNKPLEGKLSYNMTSAGFELLFRQDTLKLQIQIVDRALHESNVVETPDFVLKDITVGG